jgi:hypothetical protein
MIFYKVSSNIWNFASSELLLFYSFSYQCHGLRADSYPLCELRCREEPPCGSYMVNIARRGLNVRKQAARICCASSRGRKTAIRRQWLVTNIGRGFRELPQDIRRSLWQIYHQDPPINGDFENLRRITVQSSPMTLPGVSNMIVEVRFRSWEFQRSVPRRRNFCSTKRFA